MDGQRFDTLVRTLSSRRVALGGLLGGLATVLGLPDPKAATAHNFLARCGRLPTPTQRRACRRRARAHNRKHRCRAESPSITCDNRCGTARNNCNKPVSCTCPTGKACLANNRCNLTCDPAAAPCPAGCFCGARLAEDLSLRQCQLGTPITDCAQIPQSCVTSADCPSGFFCGSVGAQCVTNRCIPTCQERVVPPPV